MRIFIALATGSLALAAIAAQSGLAAESMVRRPKPAQVIPNRAPQEVAYFAGGCFWGVEAVFEHVKGVKSAVSGYAGGTTRGPTYSTVSMGSTGHAETVKVTFDPRQVSYTQLLQIYFSVVADPTQLNRQGPDTGTQYRTALFPTSKAQAQQARSYIAQLGRARAYRAPIVTRVEPLGAFTTAEAYHQDYLAHHPNQPYIVVNDRPKVAALKRQFPELWRA